MPPTKPRQFAQEITQEWDALWEDWKRSLKGRVPDQHRDMVWTHVCNHINRTVYGEAHGLRAKKAGEVDR